MKRSNLRISEDTKIDDDDDVDGDTKLLEKSSSTVQPRHVRYEVSSEDDDEDVDYSVKFNSLAGWKSVILMQFQTQMRIAILLSIYITYVCAIIDFAFAYPIDAGTRLGFTWAREAVNGIVYTSDVIYAMDCASMFIFKRMKWNEMKHRYKTRSDVILAIEIISLVPLEAVYGLMATPLVVVSAALKLRYALRMIRLYSYVVAVRDYVGNNAYLLHVCIYIVLMTLLVITTTCFAYIYNCNSYTSCITPNYRFFLVVLYLTSAIWTFVGVTTNVAIVVVHSITLSIMGCLTKTIFTGFFVCSILRKIHAKCCFMRSCMRRRNTLNERKEEYLKEWTSYHKKFELVMKENAVTVYERTEGNNPSEYLGKFLPTIIYKEIYLDLSWAPLKHSRLFRNEDVSFLRIISLALVQKFFCPGEIIYKRDEYKTFMIYIVSGTVEVLSEEDGETPIMTLTSGSCLGESSLVISYPSTCTVVTKGTCDVVILNRHDLARITRLYPRKMKRIIGDVSRRHAAAKSFRIVSEYQFNIAKYEERTSVLTMKWLKHTLKGLTFNARKSGDMLHRHHLAKLENNIFCSKYLDLLAQPVDDDIVNDAVFIRADFPFVFRPNSVLIKLWNSVVKIILIYTLISFPWCMVYYVEGNTFYRISFAFVTIFWLCDIYFKSSTAVVSKHRCYNTVSDIIIYNLSSFTFILDILAAIPLEILVYLITGKLSEEANTYSSMNRLIKVYKLEELFTSTTLDTRTLVHVTFTRFCVYLFLIIYYLTTVFYIFGNLPANREYFIDFVEHFGSSSTLQQILVSLWSAMEFYCNLHFGAFPFGANEQIILILTFFQVVVGIFNIVFIVYLSAVVTMDMMDEHQVDEFHQNLAITMKSYKLSPTLQKRVWRYVNLHRQRYADYFLRMDQVFENVPSELAIISREIELSEFLKCQPFFSQFDNSTISRIAYVATFQLVPEREVIRRVGEICPEFYMLMKGTCRLSNRQNMYKTVYQAETFNVLEACLGMKSLVTIWTETPCLMVVLTTANLRGVLLRNINDYKCWKDAVDYYPYYNKFKIITPFLTTDQIDPSETKREYQYFGYVLKKQTRRYQNFYEGFTRRTCIFQHMLMHVVFSNQSTFVYYWEVARVTFAVMIAIVVPVDHFLDNNALSYFAKALDYTAYADVYLRHHVSYFNRKGVEVMHPMLTAKYYWKHAFVVDLLACLPFEYLLAILFGQENITQSAFKYTRYLQLYRFRYFVDGVFKRKYHLQRLDIIKYIPYVVILVNALAAFYLMGVCIVSDDGFACEQNSSVNKLVEDSGGDWNNNNVTMTTVYCWAIYITSAALTYSNHFIIHIGLNVEIFFFAVVGFMGTVGINVFLAKMIEVNLSINHDLNAFQEALQRLNVFLSFRKVDKRLKSELVNHFEFLWKRNKGKDIHNALAFFKRSFKVDALYNIYGVLLVRSTIFPAPNETFFRSVLLEATYEMYLRDAYIYSVNDINGDIYILLKGSADVIGADGNKLTSLTPGSVFGNLDDCRLSRKTVGIVCETRVAVLKFHSYEFHQHLKRFYHLRKYFYQLTVFDVDYLIETSPSTIAILNMTSSSFVKKIQMQSSFGILTKNIFRLKILRRTKAIRAWESFVCYVAYFSYYVETFHLSTMANSTFIYAVLYSIDAIFLIKIYIMFHTSYDDEYGRTVMRYGKIARRYLKMRFGFVFDVCTTFPVDILIYAAFTDHPNKKLIYSLLRLNRLPRVILGLRKLKQLTEKLNVIIVVVRMCYLFAWMCLIIWTLASLMAFYGYRHFDTVSMRFAHFTTAVHYIMCASTSMAKEIPPTLRLTAAATIGIALILLVSKMVYMVFLTECCSILMVVNHTRSNYERFMIFIDRYLKYEHVSTPLIERVLNYTNLLWAYHRGVHFPPLLEQAPYYLREAVLNSMFGRLLDKHPTLRHIHKDLARQMVARTKTVVFFPGDIVAYVGDIDCCMYFIDRGEVVAISEDTMYSEVVDHVLHGGDMFGLNQGIMYNFGHQFTYKVMLYTVLVVLKRDDWIWLLDFFPASKTTICDSIGIELGRIHTV